MSDEPVTGISHVKITDRHILDITKGKTETYNKTKETEKNIAERGLRPTRRAPKGLHYQILHLKYFWRISKKD